MNKQEALDKIEELKKVVEEFEQGDIISKYVKENPIRGGENRQVIIDERVIKVPLPCANDAWTFEVWVWVKAFCDFANNKGYYAFPTHYEDEECYNFQYISYSKRE